MSQNATINERAEQLLRDHHLRITKSRIEVLAIFIGKEKALSLPMLHDHFNAMDRVTLYRTLKSFEEQGLIHKAVDGTEVAKYAMCSHNCPGHKHQESHAHFHCDDCGDTFCLDDLYDVGVTVPSEFDVHTTNVIFHGRCKECRLN